MRASAIILAAGLGTRLRAAEPSRPKVLVEVGGQPLIQRHLRALEAAGFTSVVVNAHHLSEQVERFADAYSGPLDISVVVEPEPLGTAGGVRNALDLLLPGPIVVIYGDVLMDAPVADIVADHQHARPDATLAVYTSVETEGKGTLELGDDASVRRFREKVPPSGAPEAINAGLYVVEASLLERLDHGAFADFGHDVFPAALKRGVRLKAFALNDSVLDIGTPEALARAREAADD